MKKRSITNNKMLQAIHTVKMREVIGGEQTSTPTDPCVDYCNPSWTCKDCPPRAV